MRRRLAVLVGIALLAGGCGVQGAAPSRATKQKGGELELIVRQFREYALSEAAGRGDRLLDDVELPKSPVEGALRWSGELRPDGSWPDIKYNGQTRSAWEPYDHMTRMLALAVCAERPETPPVDSAACRAALHRALAFWIKHDFQCPNWWYNDIGVPKSLGTMALLIGDDLRPDERKYMTDVSMPRSKPETRTGQNRVWEAENTLMRGVLLGDEKMVANSAALITDEVRVTDEEGIQADWSFQQHGAQQQFGNYGLAFCVEMSRWATVLRGTRFALNDEKMGVFRNLLLQGENWTVWNGAMDISACGRQLFPGSPHAKAASLAAVMMAMQNADPSHAAEYDAFIKRNKPESKNDLLGTRFFWRSDYAVHRTKTFAATLKMSSTRVVGGETVNNENLSGANLADGAIFFYRTGREYADIFPVWDWRKIPGTTAEQGEGPPAWPPKKKKEKPDQVFEEPTTMPGRDFVGGVSDGTNACAAMDFDRAGVRAKKSWFFVDNVVVCLGADIRSDGKGDVVTTIDQCLLDGEQPIRNGTTIHHGGFRYVLVGNGNLMVRSGKATGSWKKVFDIPSTPKADVTRQTMTLSIDHGVNPDGADYAYYITSEKNDPRVEVLANTKDVQAVRVDGRIVQAVFWNRGKIEGEGYSIEVDIPCVVSMTADGNHIWVADPTQKLKEIGIGAGGSWVVVDLPQGVDAGKSVELGG